MQVEGLVNITKNMISRIELGDRYVTDLELIAFAKVLNVSTAWLLEETSTPDR
jgi:transcriptional regulator with XRE-family HTH domain